MIHGSAICSSNPVLLKIIKIHVYLTLIYNKHNNQQLILEGGLPRRARIDGEGAAFDLAGPEDDRR